VATLSSLVEAGGRYAGEEVVTRRDQDLTSPRLHPIRVVSYRDPVYLAPAAGTRGRRLSRGGIKISLPHAYTQSVS
jgi:hypothetical protein